MGQPHRLLISVLLFIGAGSGWAQAGSSSFKDSGLYGGPAHLMVNQLDPQFPVHEFEKAGFWVETVKGRMPTSDRIPHPATRNAFFVRAQISGDVKSWNHYTKDLLYLRARTGSLSDLKREYPQIDGKKLETLRRIVTGGS